MRWADESLQVARTNLANLEQVMRLHKKLCRTCRKLTEIQRRYCEQGWETAKAIRQARQRVAKLDPAEDTGQLTLF